MPYYDNEQFKQIMGDIKGIVNNESYILEGNY